MPSCPDKIVIFHYHLLPGGLRSALSGSLEALAEAGFLDGREVEILAGRPDGVADFVADFRKRGVAIGAHVDPRLDYNDGPWPDRETFDAAAGELAADFLRRGGDATLFWIHNVTIGKNPLLTAAWREAARRAQADFPSHRFLYHIHDFAENGRPENMTVLRRCWGGGGVDRAFPPYGNTAFALINRADAERMKTAGVPPERVYYLPNRVAAGYDEKPEGNIKARLAPYLADYAARHGYRFDPERAWWVLPVRLIRRKNVLEAMVAAALRDEPPQLLLTLDANSERERPYAEAVKDLARTAHFPMVIGFGRELVGTAFSFAELLGAADAVVSTSLMEGFGFAFLDGGLFGRPLAGRDLPDVTRDFDRLGFPRERLYEQLLVDPSPASRRRLLDAAARFVHSTGREMGVSPAIRERFLDSLATLMAAKWVDFGLLDFAGQEEIVRRLDDAGFRAEIRKINPRALMTGAFPDDFAARVNAEFGTGPHGERLRSAFTAVFDNPGSVDGPDDIGSWLLDEFFAPHHQRALYGGW